MGMLAPTLLFAAVLAQTATSKPGFDFAPGDDELWRLQDRARARQQAERQITDAPGSLAAFNALLQFERGEKALDALMRLLDASPRESADALTSLGSWLMYRSGARDSPKLPAIFAAAHARASLMPREDAATLEFALARAEGGEEDVVRARLTALVERFNGTRAAGMAEISLLPATNIPQQIAGLDAIARAHPGTEVAAAALYQKGWQLVHNMSSASDPRRDPTDRFRRVLEIAGALESSAYPKGPWTDKAASLVVEFYADQPRYTPQHLDETIAAYRTYAKTHFAVEPVHVPSDGWGHVVNVTMRALFELKGDPDGVDRVLRELETESPDPQGAGYLRAVIIPVASPKRAELLDAIAADGHNAYAAKALATRARDELAQGHAAVARERYRQFLQRYPRSDYAWVAALRAAEADDALGDWASAERGFLTAANNYADTSLAVITGRVYAAYAAEALGQPSRALNHLVSALAAWDRDTPEVSLFTTPRTPVFYRTWVAQRIEALRASLARPGAEILEHGRWQLSNGDRAGAIGSFEDLIARDGGSPVLAEATVLLHRAQLEAALDLGDIERADADPVAAARQIERLSRLPLDSAVVAARIARAARLWKRGAAAAAREAMASTLAAWVAAEPHDPPRTELEQDVAAIRDAVFRPLGDGIYADQRPWNAFEWPARLPRFLLMDPQIAVKLPSGDETIVTVTRPLPGFSNVVFSDSTMLDLLSRTIDALGGTKRRQPGAIMERPNQPVGDSMKILALWNEYFPTRPGHWGGFEFTTDPCITRVVFLDASRTQAAANVTIGDSGATVVLEKRGDRWVPVGLTGFWVT